MKEIYLGPLSYDSHVVKWKEYWYLYLNYIYIFYAVTVVPIFPPLPPSTKPTPPPQNIGLFP